MSRTEQKKKIKNTKTDSSIRQPHPLQTNGLTYKAEAILWKKKKKKRRADSVFAPSMSEMMETWLFWGVFTREAIGAVRRFQTPPAPITRRHLLFVTEKHLCWMTECLFRLMQAKPRWIFKSQSHGIPSYLHITGVEG